MGPIRNPRWEQKRTEGYVIVSSFVSNNFCTNAKVHEMSKMLYKCANNLFFNELRIKC